MYRRDLNPNHSNSPQPSSSGRTLTPPSLNGDFSSTEGAAPPPTVITLGKRAPPGLKDDKEAAPLLPDGSQENSLAIFLNLPTSQPASPNPRQMLAPIGPDEEHDFEQAWHDVMTEHGKGPHLWEFGTTLPNVGVTLESWYESNKDFIPPQADSLLSQPTKPPPTKKANEKNRHSSARVPSSIRFSPNHNRIYINKAQVRPPDVFLGQSSKDSDHPGNEYFRRVINENFEEFQGYGNEHQKKTMLRNYIVNTLLQGRRFLVSCDPPPGERQDVKWYYLQTESKVRAKVRAALHDKHF